MLIERYKINNDTVTTIGEFSILWCQFEGQLFGKNMEIDDLKEWADEYLDDGSLETYCKAIKREALDFLEPDAAEAFLNRTFIKKNKGDFESRKLVSNFLDVENPEIIFKSYMIYILRVRNNLFHGLKGICLLDNQKSMFTAINELLNYILEKEGI